MIYNPYIVVPLATWAVAQVAKFAIAAIKGRIDFRYLYASGGMPSVHSAVVSALAVTALLVDGPNSAIFGFTVIFAAIVMYDSFGVRRSVGEQAVAMNLMLESMERNRFKFDGPRPHLRQILGHQPREVLAGAITGTVLAGFFNYDRLGAFGKFLQTVPVRYELWSYAAIFAVMVIVGFIIRIVLGRRYKKSKVMKRFRAHLFTATQTVGWIGLLSCGLIFERASYMAWRVWPVAILAVAVLWFAFIMTGSAKDVPAGLAAEATEARKRKWLSFGRKSR